MTSNDSKVDDYFEEIARTVLYEFKIEIIDNSDHSQIPGERVRRVVAVGELIEDASFLLVNITRHTADLMYSIGYAHALGKLAMFYVHEDANNTIPSFLAGYIYRVYNSSHDLGEYLYKDVKRYISRESDEIPKI